MDVQARAELRAEDETLFAHEVRAWLEKVPDGASLTPIIKDFGSQRDPDEKLIGLRASWSETR